MNNHYIDERKEIMKKTISKVEDFCGDVMSNDYFSQEQTNELNNLSAKIM